MAGNAGMIAEAALQEDYRDCLQELSNIAIGRTADKVARRFSTSVQMPVPRVHLLQAADVPMLLSAFDGSELITALAQPFFGAGISGEALLLVSDATLSDLSQLMGYPAGASEEEQLEQLLEMTSLLTGPCIHTLLQQLEIDELIGHPRLLARHTRRGEMLSGRHFSWARTLAIELNYGFEDYAIRCDLILLFHEQAFPVLRHKLDLLLS